MPGRRHRKRPSGDEVDAELPERAFESDKDANDFFDRCALAPPQILHVITYFVLYI